MKIHSIEFTKNWSWGLIWSDMINQYSHIIERTFMNDGGKIPESVSENDIILCQNVTLLKKFKERLKTVCRMGGNYNFDGQDFEKLNPLLNEMSKCNCIIATNKKLYNIASAIHNNVFLVPNGIDLKQWYPCPKKEERPFTVGFCGNISNTFYREYKGYDRLRMACKILGVELKDALYKDGQIPHDKMMKDFYWKIDCLVHPTLGEGCIPEDQELFVNNRLTKARDVKVGDNLWGGIVENIYDNGISNEWHEFSTGRLPSFQTTEEHPIRIANWKWRWSINGKKTTKRQLTELTWKLASEVKEGEYLVVPKYKIVDNNTEIVLRGFKDKNIKQSSNTTFELDEDFAYLLGWYLAEGSVGDRTQIHLSLGSHEIDSIKQLQEILNRKLGKDVNYRAKKSVLEIRFRHAPLAEWLIENFGKDVYEKRIPEIIMKSEKNIVKRFVEGYLHGDGHNEKGQRWFIQNASKELSYQFVLLLTKLDILPALYVYKRKNRNSVIKGREVHLSEYRYCLRLSFSYKNNAGYFQDESNFYVKIKKINIINKESRRVNFETSTSEFNALYFNTHNCSNTLMEACACGIPIITTREAGFHGEFMKDGYDVLFCTREIMDIKDKIQKLMNKKTLQEKLGRRSRRFAEKHHDIKVIAKKYEEIFQDCYRQNQKLHV
jgi:glycosyltransferase involved in cell wall biosynthesis